MSMVSVRYMVHDVDAAIAFYTTHLGFRVQTRAAPAFADVVRGDLRLLLSARTSSAGRPMPDGRQPEPGGWNRIHLIVDDIEAEVARLRAAGVRVDMAYGDRGVKGAMRAADRSGAAIALVVGDGEIEAGTVKVKDLATGEQVDVAADDIQTAVLTRLG